MTHKASHHGGDEAAHGYWSESFKDTKDYAVMSASGNLGQHPDVYYAPFETGSSGRRATRSQPKDGYKYFALPVSETEEHLQRAHDLLARIRQAVRSGH